MILCLEALVILLRWLILHATMLFLTVCLFLVQLNSRQTSSSRLSQGFSLSQLLLPRFPSCPWSVAPVVCTSQVFELSVFPVLQLGLWDLRVLEFHPSETLKGLITAQPRLRITHAIIF